MDETNKCFWICWTATTFPKAIDPSWPWWIDAWVYGSKGEATPVMVGALIAKNEEEAKRRVSDARIGGPVKAFRSCEEKPADWSPYSERYPEAPWMNWPEPAPK